MRSNRDGNSKNIFSPHHFSLTATPLSTPSLCLWSPPAQPSGLLAAQGQRRDGSVHLLHVPHRPLPLHVLGVWPALRRPALRRALPLAAHHQRGKLVHPGAAGLLVRSALPKGLPPVQAQPHARLRPRRRARRRLQGQLMSPVWLLAEGAVS